MQNKYLNKKTIKAALLVGLITLSCLLLYSRIKSEKENKAVELCLSFEEAYDLCFVNNYDFVDFLKRAQAIGVASFSVSEETLSSFANSGKLIFYSMGEYKRMQLLDVVSGYGKVNNDTIVAADKDFAQQITEQLTKRYGFAVIVDKAGKNTILNLKFNSSYRPGFWSDNLSLGFNPEKIKQLKDLGLKVVLRPQNIGNPVWMFENLPDNISGFLWEGKEIAGYPAKDKETGQNLIKSGVKYFSLEFCKLAGEDTLIRSNPAKMVSGHVISADELNANQNPAVHILRWVRAVKERGNRFLYFHFFKNRPVEDNMTYLRSTAKRIKQEGFYLEPSSPPAYPMGKLIFERRLLIFIIAIFFPIYALYKGKSYQNPAVSYAVINSITVSGGLLIAAFFYDLIFMQRIILPYSVKLSILMPLLLAVFVLYNLPELRNFLRYQVKGRHILYAALAALVLGVMLLRSGNYQAGVSPLELKVRQFLENVFIVRPRSKEFLFGQPLLLAGLYFKKRSLILLGMLGQVSIINTFMHAHTPVLTSLLRVFHGVWLGFFIGMTAIAVFEFTKAIRIEEK
ncbi:MAG: DUF5693 family protein [Elusimicrobia bacterium]|nr:DUF5693 family protein [Candidatus Liberimonas magnetica]